MVEGYKELERRLDDLSQTIANHAEKIHRTGVALQEALKLAMQGKISSGDPNYDELLRRAKLKLKARGLGRSPAAQPESVDNRQPTQEQATPKHPRKLSDLHPDLFDAIVADATEAEKQHPDD